MRWGLGITAFLGKVCRWLQHRHEGERCQEGQEPTADTAHRGDSFQRSGFSSSIFFRFAHSHVTVQRSVSLCSAVTRISVLFRNNRCPSPPQVLLSQVHRLRALDLLGRFLDLGPWAVSLVRGCCMLPCASLVPLSIGDKCKR